VKVDYRAKLIMVKEFLDSQRLHARRLEKMGTLTIDNRQYARVLARVLPRVIASDKEYERMLGEVENLMDKGERRSAGRRRRA
jgi:hypothetical protein